MSILCLLVICSCLPNRRTLTGHTHSSLTVRNSWVLPKPYTLRAGCPRGLSDLLSSNSRFSQKDTSPGIWMSPRADSGPRINFFANHTSCRKTSSPHLLVMIGSPLVLTDIGNLDPCFISSMGHGKQVFNKHVVCARHCLGSEETAVNRQSPG